MAQLAGGRGYDLVILSDHGMTPALSYRVRFGESLGTTVQKILDETRAVPVDVVKLVDAEEVGRVRRSEVGRVDLLPAPAELDVHVAVDGADRHLDAEPVLDHRDLALEGGLLRPDARGLEDALHPLRELRGAEPDLDVIAVEQIVPRTPTF